MKKIRTVPTKRQASSEVAPTVTIQLPLPMIAAMREVQHGFHSLCLDAGRRVLSAMMENDRTALCGPKWTPDGERKAVRGGSTQSLIVFGGRKIGVKRPRVRLKDGHEGELPSFAWAADRDPLDAQTLDAIACGVSSRKYKRSLETLAPEEREVSVSRSAVSRRFVAQSTKVVEAFLSRPLGDLKLRVIMIDGIIFRDHAILIALGITSGGEKLVVGVREGSTENAAVAKALLGDLIERGLSTEQRILFGVDGGKGLRSAIVSTFGEFAVIQRCQTHKTRNVTEHLPKPMRRGVGRAMREAYATPDAALAKRRFEQLANSLERQHPGAAASLREGLVETLTLSTLGINGSLYRSLRTTNIIENLNGSVALFARNVRHWRDGQMIVRWVTSAVCEAEKRFNHIKGYQDMARLVTALDAPTSSQSVDTRKKAA